MKTVLFALLIVVAQGGLSGAAPTFFDRHDYPGTEARGVAIADTNGDGIPDLIGVDGRIAVLFGNGDGTFRTGPVSDLGMNVAYSILVSDVNGDGKLDLILPGGLKGTQVPQGIGISFGNGDGTFQPVVFYAAGTDLNVTTAIFADLNGDGIPDIAAQGRAGIWLFTGRGGGSFNDGVLIPINGSGTFQILAAADVDGDSKRDLVASTAAGFTVLRGIGDGTFQPQIDTSTPYTAEALRVADLNGDGHPDVVVGNWGTGHVFIYAGNGDGTFRATVSPYLPGSNGIAIGDVNGDGIPDLISQDAHVAFGKGDGTFKQSLYFPVAYAGAFGIDVVALGDLRGSGRVDIVTANNLGSQSVLLNLGHGSFEDGIITPVPISAGCPVVADFNGDGKQDVAVGDGTSIVVLFGTGKATAPFQSGPVTTIGNIYCAPAGDLNNDGIPDLMVPGSLPPPSTGETLTPYIGKGDGTFTPGASTTIASAGLIRLVDINRDGKLDYITSSNLLALGNGDGTFQAPAPYVPKLLKSYTVFNGIAVGDLNGDHFPDVVLADGTNSLLYILLNNRQGGFKEAVLSTDSACGYADVPTIADLNATVFRIWSSAAVMAARPSTPTTGRARLPMRRRSPIRRSVTAPFHSSQT